MTEHQQIASEILASNPRPVEVYGAMFLMRNILNAPLSVQDFEFLEAIKAVEKRG